MRESAIEGSTDPRHAKAIVKIGAMIENYALFKNHKTSVEKDTAIREDGEDPTTQGLAEVDVEPDILVYEYDRASDAKAMDNNYLDGQHKARVVIEVAHDAGVEKDKQKCVAMLKTLQSANAEAFVYDFVNDTWYKYARKNNIVDERAVTGRKASVCDYLGGLDLSAFNNPRKKKELLADWMEDE